MNFTTCAMSEDPVTLHSKCQCDFGQ